MCFKELTKRLKRVENDLESSSTKLKDLDKERGTLSKYLRLFVCLFELLNYAFDF